MKKILMLAAVAGFLGNAQACSVPNSTTDDVRALVNEKGGWPISDAQCAILNKQNLLVNVSGTATVLSNASVGWALVTLVDPNNIVSDAQRSSTYVNSSSASMDVAKGLLYSSIKDAIKGLDFSVAAKQIADQKAKLKGGRQ
jgi:hypothetical protein